MRGRQCSEMVWNRLAVILPLMYPLLQLPSSFWPPVPRKPADARAYLRGTGGVLGGQDKGVPHCSEVSVSLQFLTAALYPLLNLS